MEISIDRAREVLGRTPAVLQAMLPGLSEGWVAGDEGAGTWSPYQVVGHLTFIEERDWISRIRLVLEHGTERVFEPVDREAGFALFKGWTLDQLLGRFSLVRASNLEELESLMTDDDLERRGRHPAFGDVTLGQLVATWVVHDLNHLGQVVKTMAKQGTHAVGPWRQFLPILDAP